jgi:hypothetical protein
MYFNRVIKLNSFLIDGEMKFEIFVFLPSLRERETRTFLQKQR